MNKSKYSVAIGLIALAFMAPANAAIVETFNLDNLGSGLLQGAPQGTPLGTVTLTQSGSNVEVNVALAGAAYSNGAYFVNTSNGNSMTPFVFNLNTSPVSISSITATQTGSTTTSTSVFTNAAGPFPATPFGNFANGVVCSNCSNGGSPPHYSILDFTITGVSIGNFIGNNDPSGNWYFAADVYNNGYTGTVASTMSAVPEPRTYAMLLAGLGLIAFTVRRNKYLS